MLGSIRAQAYMDNDGTTRASLELTAQEVQFLTPRGQAEPEPTPDEQAGFVRVEDEHWPEE